MDRVELGVYGAGVRWTWLGAALAAAVISTGCDASDDGSASDDGTGEETGGDGDGDGDGGFSVTCDGPCPTQWPEPTGPCPDLTTGVHSFAPEGIEPRDVKLWVGGTLEEQDGPLVFYWHGTGSQPDEALYGLGVEAMEDITSQGGMVAAPFHDPEAGQYPWFLTAGDREDDLILADEILGCMIQNAGVDGRRIHVTGMSAGGLMTTQMSYRRSNYIASVAPHSGGLLFSKPPVADPDNKFAAMILYGGEDDIVVVSFEDTSTAYFEDLRANGQFAMICNHEMNHTIAVDAVPSLWQFFQDHPYGTDPSPYVDGLPDGFPDYCSLELPPG